MNTILRIRRTLPCIYVSVNAGYAQRHFDLRNMFQADFLKRNTAP